MADTSSRDSRGWAPVACGILVVALLTALPRPVLAQESRREQIAQQQAEKARQAHPYVQTTGEKIADGVESFLAGVPKGFYPWVGSILGGGWMAFGGGYTQPIGDTGQYNLLAGWSLRNYKLLQGTVRLPEFANRMVRVDLDARWLDAPRVSYYGLGNDSHKEDKTSYGYTPTGLDARVTVTPRRWLYFGGGVGYLNIDTDEGSVDPSIERVFTPVTAPGLGQDVTYSVAGGFAAIDWRESPGYTRRGGLYRVDFRNFADSDDLFGYTRLDLDLRQFVPLLRANWVLAFRAAASLTNADDGEQVPYFVMPYLGSGETLRGYANRRFRDRNMLLLQGEYRWTPSHFLDMAIFVDAGKVAARRGDLDLDDLKTDWGIGARFHGPSFTALRIELARSDEGWKLVWASGFF